MGKTLAFTKIALYRPETEGSDVLGKLVAEGEDFDYTTRIFSSIELTFESIFSFLRYAYEIHTRCCQERYRGGPGWQERKIR